MCRFGRSQCHKAFQKKCNPRRARQSKRGGIELTLDLSLGLKKITDEPVNYKKKKKKSFGKPGIKAMNKMEENDVRRQSFFTANSLKNKKNKGKELRKAADDRSQRQHPSHQIISSWSEGSGGCIGS
ncbi:ribosome biogenesis protein RLP24 [Biomphalaria pfeifferi]|uniref:Ribosome biogenesis protein RLP24 n=1 Tax=Biomphalaria pfeifferi TaxID=112525 RepID=A0AAD8C5B8_BIOPF|nr:ribosome biogenesis protein RLP24 [Biomphalaria pfeifferi]